MWILPKWRVKRTRMRSASPRSTARRTIASARYVRDAIGGQWYLEVTANFEARFAAIDDEIRSLLTQSQPSLQPFYGMMQYHLGLDADKPRGGETLPPLPCAVGPEDPRRGAPRGRAGGAAGGLHPLVNRVPARPLGQAARGRGP